MNYFEAHEYFPGINHIDSNGVMMTLIVCEKTRQAILFDSGYGLIDPRPFIDGLLEKHGLEPGVLKIVMSHVHHDHILGGQWFGSFYLHKDDAPLVDLYTNERHRTEIIEEAKRTNSLPEAFDRAAYFSAAYNDRVCTDIPALSEIEILHIPGHTPGSLMLYVPAHKLILTGDNWNPTTWLFFPEALPVRKYAENMKRLLSLDFEYVLCSHSPELFEGKRLKDYINGLSEKTFAEAAKILSPSPQNETNTLLCHPEPDTNLVFRG